MASSEIDVDALRSAGGVSMRSFITQHNDTYPFIDPLKGDLSGRSIVITGATRGIGRSTAISFARAGCSKIGLSARSDLTDVRLEVLEAAKKAGRPEPTVVVLSGVDVADEGHVQRFASLIQEQFGGVLDILVNNAGILEPWVPLGDSDPSLWWRTWEVNLRGAYLCARFFMPMLLASPLKTILNISSNGALHTLLGASAYQMSKFALARLTEFLTMDYYDNGLVAMCLHPGGVVTEAGLNMPEKYHYFLTDTPELAGDFMAWLCSEKRDWLSGRWVNVKWDAEELLQKREKIESDFSMLKFRLVMD